jgi:hypothetical protein
MNQEIILNSPFGTTAQTFDAFHIQEAAAHCKGPSAIYDFFKKQHAQANSA